MIDIDEYIKNSLKSGNKSELKAYRNLKAEFQKIQTSKDYKGEWNKEIELQTLAKYGRQLDAAIAEFGGSQTDLGKEYSDELEIIKKLLPEPVNESDIYSYLLSMNFQKEMFPENIEKIEKMQNLGIRVLDIEIPKKEMGRVIKHLKSKFPTADGKMISDVVKKYIV